MEVIGPMEKQISQHIWQIGTLEFTQYLIGDPPLFLMEGGISPQSILILNQLKTRGLDPQEIQYLGILHSHFDHLGTFPKIMGKAPEAKIISGEKNIEILSRPRILERMLDSSKAITEYAKKISFLPEIYEIDHLDPLPVDIPLKDKDTLDIGSLQFTFIDLPGHSPDAIGAYLPEDGVFFCSDMAGLYYLDDTIKPNYYYSLKDYETSIEKISHFDIEILCFSHNGALTGYKNVKRFLERSIDFTNKLKKQIKDWFEAGKDLDVFARQYSLDAQKGFFAFFPFEHSLMLSHLLIRRTLEYYGFEVKPKS